MLSTIFAFNRQYDYDKILLAMVSSRFPQLIRPSNNTLKKETTYSVVARDGDIDMTKWVVRVGERNDGDVHVRSFGDGLVIGDRVSDDNQAWLLERLLDLIGKRAWRETASNRCRTFKSYFTSINSSKYTFSSFLIQLVQ